MILSSSFLVSNFKDSTLVFHLNWKQVKLTIAEFHQSVTVKLVEQIYLPFKLSYKLFTTLSDVIKRRNGNECRQDNIIARNFLISIKDKQTICRKVTRDRLTMSSEILINHNRMNLDKFRVNIVITPRKSKEIKCKKLSAKKCGKINLIFNDWGDVLINTETVLEIGIVVRTITNMEQTVSFGYQFWELEIYLAINLIFRIWKLLIRWDRIIENLITCQYKRISSF